MDTRFWGPDGWKLLHSIAVSYPARPKQQEKRDYRDFFNSIQHVLPCIYCRQSFQEFCRQLPIEDYLESRRDLSFWLHQMHNKVNDKLRNQGLGVCADADFDRVHEMYLDYVKRINGGASCSNLPGWEFIYCILFNYPLKSQKFEPIRYRQYVVFFTLLSKLMPFDALRETMSEHLESHPIEEAMRSRTDMKKWGFRLERSFCQKESITCPKFRDRCYSIELFRAGCKGRNDPKPTCHVTPNIGPKRAR